MQKIEGKMIKKLVDVYDGDRELGEVELTYQIQNGVVWKEIKISEYSQPSERCPPLAVLLTIMNTSSSSTTYFKMEAKFTQSSDSPLSLLHFNCLSQNKTAIMSLGNEEFHLVAMKSNKYKGNFPCFWGFILAKGLYNSCLNMLNLRCLGIVFDLDETLIVANTKRSFEDRIESVQKKLNSELDPSRINTMLAEIKRYQDDKFILKQYAETDQILIDGKVIKSQYEVVPALSEIHQPLVRPIIRLPDKNLILTRINPQIRDTSVLVRLRPSWEDLRIYLTAKGRKRFEVYVCTMAEKDYALEMWRLLDPNSNLINTKELLDRIVCVKSGSWKSLRNVFQDKNCHPKMALVIDDRLKVWDEKDQPRVHVVPAFAPYYAPQAEANNTVPVLCVARNVACNVRGSFFREFDDVLLNRISQVLYEDDIKEIPSPPDVSNYLISEEDPSVSNRSKDTHGSDGMADSEVERRLREAMANVSTTNIEPRIGTVVQALSPPLTLQEPVVPYPSQQLTQVVKPVLPCPSQQQLTQVVKPVLPCPSQQLTHVVKPIVTHTSAAPESKTLQNISTTEEGEIIECEVDLNTKRRLLILQHGLDSRDHHPPIESHLRKNSPGLPNHGLFQELEMNTAQFHHRVQQTNDKNHQPTFLTKSASQTYLRDTPVKLDQSGSNFQSFPGKEGTSGSRDVEIEANPGRALEEIALKCGTKVEHKSWLVKRTRLEFCNEVWFAGERVAEGLGRTRKEAHCVASERALINLADKYISHKNGLQNNVNSSLPMNHIITPEPPRVEEVVNGPISALKELCIMKGLVLSFQSEPQIPAHPGQRSEMFVQVEIDGRVLGQGRGWAWDDAKAQAAEMALWSLRSMFGGQFSTQKRTRSSLEGGSNKRVKPGSSRYLV